MTECESSAMRHAMSAERSLRECRGHDRRIGPCQGMPTLRGPRSNPAESADQRIAGGSALRRPRAMREGCACRGDPYRSNQCRAVPQPWADRRRMPIRNPSRPRARQPWRRLEPAPRGSRDRSLHGRCTRTWQGSPQGCHSNTNENDCQYMVSGVRGVWPMRFSRLWAFRPEPRCAARAPAAISQGARDDAARAGRHLA